MPFKPWLRTGLFLGTIGPFLVGFDTPDSAGTTVGLGAGRGTYHLVGCRGNFDSEFWEGHATVQHRFDPKPREEGDAANWKNLYWDAWKPRHVTVGAFVDAVYEDITLVEVHRDTAGNPRMPQPVGSTFEKRGFAGGAHITGDWKWVGVTAGLVDLYRQSDLEELNVDKTDLVAGLRLGPSDFLYGTFNAYGSSPTLTGSGARNIGLGGKWRDTRIWVGAGEYPERNRDSLGAMAMLRVSQSLGPARLSLALQMNPDEIPPAGIGIDREYGASLFLEYNLP